MSASGKRAEPAKARSAFFRPFDVDSLPEAGLETTVEATESECAGVAKDLGLPAVDALAAVYRIHTRLGGRLKVDGRVRARVTRICSVTLDPFEIDIDEPVDVTFGPVSQAPPEHGRRVTARERRNSAIREVVLPPPQDGEEDPPDPIVDGHIDLGGLAVEFLTLALDFYPRKPGVHFTDVVVGDTAEPQPSAFAALERFKDRS